MAIEKVWREIIARLDAIQATLDEMAGAAESAPEQTEKAAPSTGKKTSKK